MYDLYTSIFYCLITYWFMSFQTLVRVRDYLLMTLNLKTSPGVSQFTLTNEAILYW